MEAKPSMVHGSHAKEYKAFTELDGLGKLVRLTSASHDLEGFGILQGLQALGENKRPSKSHNAFG